ncbi:MAG: 50S ribosomal protein L9 [Treponema sp.]|jgi:large subunit ribosomal protein L9|nr:50S ribosomal protein L9 [Treponema sp.]
MKVILNKDLATLGEEGDVKDVAKGYARNYLFPRGIALPYTPGMIKIIEGRRAEIEARKEQKRKDAMGLREKLENLELSITMPAGANGRLYGAVTTQTIADELSKNGFQVERKRIELSGTGFKSVGKYRAAIKLYENQSAEIIINILAQVIKTETPAQSKPARRRREDAKQDAAHQADEAAGTDANPPETANAQQDAIEAAVTQDS